MTARRLLALLVPLAAACGGSPATPDDALTDGATSPDSDVPPDAEPFVPCTVPPFTAGVSTLAGCDVAGVSDGDRATARFTNPVNVARGPDGRVYVADFDGGRIRVVDPAGAVTTLVAREHFERPFGLVFDAGGTLYVSTDNDPDGEHSTTTGTVWRVDLDSGEPTVIVEHVGRPRGMLGLPDGRLVLADYQHDVVRLLTPSTGALVELAGAYDQPGMVDACGAAARFDEPVGLALLPDGRIAVADMANHRIRAVALDGTVTTLAGTGAPGHVDGAAAAAAFARPQGLAIDAAGVLYVTDTDNHVVRRIADGEVTTLVGDGVAGWLDSDDLRAAQLYGLEGLAVAPDGSTLWIADGTRGEEVPYHRVRVAALP